MSFLMNNDPESQQSQSLLPPSSPSPPVATPEVDVDEEQWEATTVQQHPEDAGTPIQEQDGDETQLDTQFQTHEDEDGTQDAQQIGAFAFALDAANNDDWISTKKAPASSHFVAAPSAAPPRPTDLTPSASMETQPASLPVSQEDPPSEDFMPHLTNRSESAAVAADQEADAEVAAVTESAVAESAAGGPNEGDKTPLLEEEPPVMAEKPANACLFERSVMGTVSPLAQPSTEPEPVLSPAADHTTADDMDLVEQQYDASAEKADEVAENDNDNDIADHAERNEEEEENETPLQSRSDAEGVNETTATEREEENDNPVTAGVIADVTTTLQDMGCTLASTAVQQVKFRAQSAEELISFALDWIDNATTRSTRSNITTSAREAAAAPVTETTAIRSNPTHPRAYVPAVSTMRLRSVHFRAAKKPSALVSTTTRKVVSRKRKVTATATAAKTTTPTKRTYTATTTAVPARVSSSRTRSSPLTRAPATPTHKRQLRFDGEPKTKKPRVAKSVVKRCSTLCLATRAGSQNLALRPVSRLAQ